MPLTDPSHPGVNHRLLSGPKPSKANPNPLPTPNNHYFNPPPPNYSLNASPPITQNLHQLMMGPLEMQSKITLGHKLI